MSGPLAAALVANGLTNRQIAECLFIAERSAEGHVEGIRNKLGVRSRTQVATWTVEHGLMTGQTAAEPGAGNKRGTPMGPPSSRRRKRG